VDMCGLKRLACTKLSQVFGFKPNSKQRLECPQKLSKS
jgi:hypothetical protein